MQILYHVYYYLLYVYPEIPLGRILKNLKFYYSNTVLDRQLDIAFIDKNFHFIKFLK